MLSSFKDTQPQSAERLFATYESLSPIIELAILSMMRGPDERIM